MNNACRDFVSRRSQRKWGLPRVLQRPFVKFSFDADSEHFVLLTTYEIHFFLHVRQMLRELEFLKVGFSPDRYSNSRPSVPLRKESLSEEEASGLVDESESASGKVPTTRGFGNLPRTLHRSPACRRSRPSRGRSSMNHRLSRV